MAGDQKRDRVAADRIADSPGALRNPDMAGDVFVGYGLTQRDAQQGFPDLDLEIGTFDEEMQRSGFRPGGEGEHPFHEGRGLAGAMPNIGPGPLSSQIIEHLISSVARDKGNTAEPALRGGQEALAEGGGVVAERNT